MEEEVQMPDIMQEAHGIWDVGYPVPLLPRETVDYDYNSYESQGGNVSAQTNYRMWTTDATSFYYLPSAYIQVAFTVTRADGTTQVTLADNVALCSNGWSLFEDARVRINDQEISMVQKPGKCAQVINLVEKGLTWMQTIGKLSWYYVDQVSDLATIGTSGVATDTPVNYVAAPAINTVSVTDGAWQPRGMYDQIQYQKLSLDGTTSAIEAVQENPNFDPGFQDKVNRQIYVQLAGNTAATSAGPVNIFLPLKDIFPIMDLDRVVQGSKIELELNKISQTAEALFSGHTTDAKITISRIRFWVARLRPSLAALARVEQQIAENPVVNHTYDNYKLYVQPYSNLASGEQSFQIQHKQNKPTKVFIGFQYAQRSTDQRLNPLQFDLLGTRSAPTGVTGAAGTMSINMQNVQLRHNGRPVPNLPYNPLDDYSRLVYDLYRMGAKEGEDSACITMDNWRDIYPLFGFDLSLLEGAPYEARSQSTLDMFWTVSSNVTNPYLSNQNYNVYAIIVSEGSAVVDFSSGITNVRTV